MLADCVDEEPNQGTTIISSLCFPQKKNCILQISQNGLSTKNHHTLYVRQRAGKLPQWFFIFFFGKNKEKKSDCRSMDGLWIEKRNDEIVIEHFQIAPYSKKPESKFAVEQNQTGN